MTSMIRPSDSKMHSTEAFPLLSSSSDTLTPLGGHNAVEKPRIRRRSSGLGTEIRVGDTSAPAFATMDVRPPSPGALKAQSERDRKKPFSKRRKAKSLYQQWKRYAVKHTWVTPLILIGIFLALFAINPTESNPLHHFLFLSYKIPAEPGSLPGTPEQYGKGWWDFAFVTFYVVVLTFTREFIMQRFLRPLAKRSGLKSRAKQSRFMEQMYTAIYFAVMGPIGLWVMSRTPVWYFNTRGMYEGFPHKTHESYFKFYYLFQASYWAQQAFVLSMGMEAPRKDFKELVGHHITTLFLIGLSYRFHFTYMGIAVYITHDISDFFLATSKTLNYLDHPLVGPYFAVFMAAWIYLRHYLNLRILWSEFNEFKTVGPYELNWEAEQYKCELSHWISTFLLASLQGLNLFWLFYILRIAYRFIFLNALDDDRSDNDDDLLANEEKLDAMSTKQREQREALEAENTPEVLVNGKPLVAYGTTTGKEMKRDAVTNRKVERKKA